MEGIEEEKNKTKYTDGKVVTARVSGNERRMMWNLMIHYRCNTSELIRGLIREAHKVAFGSEEVE